MNIFSVNILLTSRTFLDTMEGMDMVPMSVVFACVVSFVVGAFLGGVFGSYPSESSAFRRWIETRHEYRMKLLSQRERWFEKDRS